MDELPDINEAPRAYARGLFSAAQRKLMFWKHSTSDSLLRSSDLADKSWQHWHYKNTGLLILSLIVFFIFAEHTVVKDTITHIGNFGYLGAFLIGILFVSVFTVAPASVVLFYLADNLNPFGVALAAGTGGLIGDYIIFKFLKNKVYEELEPLLIRHGGKPVRKLFRTPYFAWAIPIIGAIIVMSPAPDELGVGMMGVARMKTWKLMILLYLLDIVGVFLVIMAAKYF